MEAPADIYTACKHDVNMTAAELQKWLQTEESKSVGQASGDGERIGHHSGERIVEILGKKKADLMPDDQAHMHRVHSYVSRHSAQGPHDEKDAATSRWRYSLLNWGHNPLKKWLPWRAAFAARIPTARSPTRSKGCAPLTAYWSSLFPRLPSKLA